MEGKYGPYLRAAERNLSSEFLAWSSSAPVVLNSSSYTLLGAENPVRSSIHGGMVDQIWFRSGRFDGIRVHASAAKSDHNIISGTIRITGEEDQTMLSKIKIAVLVLLPAMLLLARISTLRWESHTDETQPDLVRCLQFGMFFMKGLCHTLLPLCFAVWVFEFEGASLDVMCFASAAARVGAVLGNICFGAVIDGSGAPRVALITSHFIVVVGALLMVTNASSSTLLVVSVAQFVISFGCAAVTPLSQRLVVVCSELETLSTQLGHMQAGGYVGGLYAAALFMTQASTPSSSMDAVHTAYATVVFCAISVGLAVTMYGRLGQPCGTSCTHALLWERWSVTPTYWLVLLQGVVCASAYDVGSYALAALSDSFDVGVGGALSAVQSTCAAVGCYYFGALSDHRARKYGLGSRIGVGSIGCVVSMFAVAMLFSAHKFTSGGEKVIIMMLAIKSFSEDAAYVGTIRPLLVTSTSPDCAAAAIALKNVLDGVVAMWSGFVITNAAQFLGYAGSSDTKEIAKQLGLGITCTYLILRSIELTVYAFMYRCGVHSQSSSKK
eukprot:TRINITY_DN5525_c0_g1_i6.p1 TRINITY_DN5525_c0_g1~~TRINITY_DN5525_c0_g1_i6.p1  ORF type:complete len:619 (-),score=76.68 TRINITY_DN5525_c0_g1_i6:74-1732(-)